MQSLFLNISGYQLEPSEMGAAFGLVQLSNFSIVKEKE